MAATYRITVNNQEPIILTDTMITFAVRKVLVGTDGQAMKSSPTVELDELCFNIADIFIVLGWILMALFFAIYTYKFKKEKKEGKIE